MTHEPKNPLLRQQVIDQHGPGTILRDFETLLDFIGTDGVRSTGKHHLLPQGQLSELDARMSKPLRPRLQRPQQRSFPHLNGLYLLLRATQLGVPKGEGRQNGTLVLEPAMLDQWRALNATERYFNLLEAWLRFGRAAMLGERGRGWYGELLSSAREMWLRVGEQGADFRGRSGSGNHLFYSPITAGALALFELLGLLDVERGEPVEGENWRILRARRTEFGVALFETIFGRDQLWSPDCDDEATSYGLWQPLLQDDFPDWKTNLQFSEPDFRDGIYLFKVKLGELWRRISIPAECDLDELACSIIKAFNFDGDHLYGFCFQERDGTEVRVMSPGTRDDWTWTDEYSVGYLPLAERQSMEFEYDFGASWRFDVKLEKVEPPNPRRTKPKIVERHGQSPKEYDDF